jgi:cytochrome b subunit of formate dehydrogenase
MATEPVIAPEPVIARPTVIAIPRKATLVRFGRVERVMHGLLMLSFLGLSFTGLPLLFAASPWAARMAGLLGGYGVTGNLHRTFAVLMMLTFGTHVARLLRRLYVQRDLGLLWGPDSLVPRPLDVVQMAQHVRYFVGLGPQPRFDRYTYWEKFDYWSVFWGMAIIGGSGLMLWFPQVFSAFLPGWVFNVAFVIHGEEALLAMVFIFTVHFFNGHLRPEKFPMDTVIFTGRITLEELKHERPAEYERLVANGGLEALRTTDATPGLIVTARLIGTLAVLLGLVMVLLTGYALMH